MDKERIQAEYLEAFKSTRTISNHWLSMVRVAGGVTFVLGLIGLILAILGELAEPGTLMQLIAIAGCVATTFQGAMIMLLAEIGGVVRDNSRMIRRIAAGFVKTPA